MGCSSSFEYFSKLNKNEKEAIIRNIGDQILKVQKQVLIILINENEASYKF